MKTESFNYVETSFGRLAYRTDGSAKPGRLPLVLLQRFRGTMDDWDPALIAALSADREVIRFDNAGIGRSGGSTPDTIESMAAVAVTFLRAAGIGKADLLGWSLGGFIAQHVALNASELVGKLIIAGSGAGAADGPPAHPKVPEIATKPQNVDDDFLFLFFTETVAGRDAGRAHLKRLQAQSDVGPLATIESVMQQGKALGQWGGTRPRLSELTLPILVANGVSDLMVPAYQSYVISQDAPNAKLILYPDSGHGFLFQYIEEFTEEVRSFLA